MVLLNNSSWLPPMLTLNGTNVTDCDKAYQVFLNDFDTLKIFYKRNSVGWSRRLNCLGYPDRFWHTVTRTHTPAKFQYFNRNRAMRVPWIKPIIEHSNTVDVQCWNYAEGAGHGIRTYFWLHRLDYVVILQNRNNRFFLVTAYCVDGPSTRNKLVTKYRNRIP